MQTTPLVKGATPKPEKEEGSSHLPYFTVFGGVSPLASTSSAFVTSAFGTKGFGPTSPNVSQQFFFHDVANVRSDLLIEASASIPKSVVATRKTEPWYQQELQRKGSGAQAEHALPARARRHRYLHQVVGLDAREGL